MSTLTVWHLFVLSEIAGPGSTWTLSIIWIQSVLGDEAKGLLCNKSGYDYCCIVGMYSSYSFTQLHGGLFSSSEKRKKLSL